MTLTLLLNEDWLPTPALHCQPATLCSWGSCHCLDTLLGPVVDG
jgi:hypothetical protein